MFPGGYSNSLDFHDFNLQNLVSLWSLWGIYSLIQARGNIIKRL